MTVLAQIIIALCGVTAIWLANDAEPRRRRFACLFGLAAQPAWFYVTWTAGQYGIFALALLYTWSWYRGFRRDWMEPKFEKFPWKRIVEHRIYVDPENLSTAAEWAGKASCPVLDAHRDYRFVSSIDELGSAERGQDQK